MFLYKKKSVVDIAFQTKQILTIYEPSYFLSKREGNLKNCFWLLTHQIVGRIFFWQTDFGGWWLFWMLHISHTHTLRNTKDWIGGLWLPDHTFVRASNISYTNFSASDSAKVLLPEKIFHLRPRINHSLHNLF